MKFVISIILALLLTSHAHSDDYLEWHGDGCEDYLYYHWHRYEIRKEPQFLDPTFNIGTVNITLFEINLIKLF